MKQLLTIAIMCLFTSSFVQAQSKQQTAVGNAVEKLRQAMVDADKATLESSVADKLSYGHSGGHIDDKKEFVDKIASGKSDFVTIDLTEQTISISGKTAIVRHILTAKTNDGGKPADVHLRVILVWQKKAGKWLLLARQAVKIT
jgi:ketosteroid isomerase-like protein